jgi:formamidopyrimidine-DNA glycosylase
MPESAECKHQAEFLSQILSGQAILKTEIVSGRYLKKSFEGFDQLVNNLPIICEGVGVHGKFIYAVFGGGSSLFITLGMSGWFSTKLNKHSRFKIETQDNEIYFNDIRNFGTLKWVRTKEELKNKLSTLGPDIANTNLSNQIFLEKLRTPKNLKLNICEVIMNQKNIAGIGNYMKAEALYLSKIDPRSKVFDLTIENLVTIIERSREIAQISYDLGGATIKSYRTPSGTSGEFSRRFHVYGQSHDPLENLVERLETPDGRTTHWVPKIQNNLIKNNTEK